MNDAKKVSRKRFIAGVVFLTTAIVLFGIAALAGGFAQTTEAAAPKAISPEQAEVAKFGLIAAAVAFGLGALGAGIGIGNVGAAAMGAIAEKPSIAGQALIFVALAEGILVFGFVMALMILGRI